MAKSKPVKKVPPKREAKGGTKKNTVATPVIGRPRYEDGKIILRMAIKDSYDDFVLLDVADDDTDEDNAAELLSDWKDAIEKWLYEYSTRRK